MSDVVTQSERLTLRRFGLGDAAFVLELLNEPAFKEYIGDKGVQTLADAVDYIADGPLMSYADHGYGVYVVVRADDGARVGMCGLFKRANLDHPDLGFAFLERYFRHGYARESSLAVIRYAGDELALPRVAAIVDAGNVRSIALIEKLGFADGGGYRMPGEDHELRYFVRDLERPA